MNVAISYPNTISKMILCSAVARNKIIKKPRYAEIMEKIPYYPGKKDNEKFEKLLQESKEISTLELNKINIPTIVFNGGIKDIVPLDEVKYISSNINNSKLLIIENAGHCNYVFNNKQFYNKLIEFLDK